MELEQLIQAVRDQRVIWDSRLSGYRDLTAKENAWDEVASTLGKNKKDVKADWRKLRDSHRQARARRAVKGGANKKKWKYLDQMEFLLTYTDEEPGPEDEGEVGVDIILEENQDEEFTLDQEGVVESQQDENVMNRERRRRVLHYLAEKEKRKQPAKKSDELELFFASIAETVRKLPRHLQRRVKLEILNSVNLAEEQSEENT